MLPGMSLNIGIIGSGHVGGTLGKRWAETGHAVTFSSRHPGSNEMKKLVGESGKLAKTASVHEAAAANDVLLLATPWPNTRAALETAGDLSGKILIDATNPLLPKLDGLEVGTTLSGAEQIAEWSPGARVVKAFNTIGFNIMANPQFGGNKAVLFYCGDDAEAKRIVEQLSAELGFDPIDAGALRQARLLEPFALLWISLAYIGGHGREIAFQFMKRSG
jgi:8-hydroxy-5-deazaflavin:NADPH oxidoreductase